MSETTQDTTVDSAYAANAAEIELLARVYVQRKSRPNQEAAALSAVVEASIDYVRAIVRGINNPIVHLLSEDDLTQVGMLGLMSALKSYKPDQGTRFKRW